MSIELNLTTNKNTIENSIENIIDQYGIAEDHNEYTVSLQKGYKYLFEIESTSIFKDIMGINRFNNINLSIKDPNLNLLSEKTGLKIDKNIAGITTVTYVASETGTYTLDIFGKAGFADTDEYGNSTRIDSPFKFVSQDLGQVDIHSDTKSYATSITLDQESNGFNYKEIDGSIYDGNVDVDWFTFDAQVNKDYIITVTFDDGVYKRLHLGNNLNTFFDLDRTVIAGKDLTNTEQYYYTPTQDETKEFSITGGKGNYTLKVEEANLDPESDTIDNAKVLTLDTTYATSLFSIYDTDFFKIENLTSGTAYKVTLTTNELNSITENNAFMFYGNDAAIDDNGTTGSGWDFDDKDSTDLLWGGSFGWNGAETTKNGGINEYYFTATDTQEYYLKLMTFFWDNVRGDYDIKVEEVIDEAEDTIVTDESKTYTTLQVDTEYSTFLNINDKDVYKIDMSNAGTYTVITDGFGGFGYNIYNEDGTRYTENGGDGGWYNTTIETSDKDLIDIPWAKMGYSDDSGYHRAVSITVDESTKGTYYLVLDENLTENYDPTDEAESVNFKLRYSNIDDTLGGNTKDTAQSIDVGSEYTADILQSSDEDWFKINLKKDEQYLLGLDSINIYNYKSNLIATLTDGINDTEIDISTPFTVENDGEYYVKFNLKYTFFLMDGEYKFTIKPLSGIDAGDTIQTASDYAKFDYEDNTFSIVESSTTYSEELGNLKSSSKYKNLDHIEDGIINGRFENITDKDIFFYDFNALTQYNITLDYKGGSGEVKFYDENGNRVKDGIEKKGDWLNPYYSLFSETGGKYYIETSRGNNYWSAETQYSLTIENTNKADSVGASMKTSAEYTSAYQLKDDADQNLFKIDFDKDKDWFKIDTIEGNYYKIEVDSEDMEFLDLKIFDSAGNEVSSTSELKTIHGIHASDFDVGFDPAYYDQNWESDKDVSLTLFASTALAHEDDNGDKFWAEGTSYYIQVANSNETGSYNLTVELDTTTDDYGITTDRSAEFKTIDTDNNNTISASFEKKNDSDWIHYEWEKAVYEVIIDAPSVDTLGMEFYATFGGDTAFDVRNWFDIFDNFTANRNDDSQTARNYIFKSNNDANYLAYMELKAINGAGDYNITINKIADLDQTPIEIELDNNKSFSKTDDSIKYQTDKSKYSINTTKDTTYQIELNATDTQKAKLGQLLINIYDAKGNIQEILKEWSPTDVMERAIFTALDDGEYVIEIQTSNSANIGEFSFNIKEIDMSNDAGSTVSNNAKFLDLAQNNIVTSTIDTTIDKDWYEYEFSKDKQYLISINTTESNGNGIIYIYDEDGNIYKQNQFFDTNNSLIDSDKTILFNPTEDGKYFVSVADSIAGQYQLQIQEYIDTNDIENNANTNVTITVDGNKIESMIDNKDDKDWIKVTLEEGKVYNIQATASGDQMPKPVEFSINGIYDTNSNLIAGTSTILSSQVIKPQTTGEYYIEVSSNSSTIGLYTLEVTSDSSSDSISSDQNTTASMNIDDKYNGNIDYFYDKDWVKITLEANTKYDVNMVGDSLKNTHITGIYNPSHQIIADSSNNDANNFTLDSKVTFTTTDAGDYYIEASAYDNLKGSYTLEVTKSTQEESLANETQGNDANNTTSNSIETSLGKYKYGEINYATDTDLFKIELEANVEYEISMYGASSKLGSLSNTFIKSIKDENGVEISGYSNARGGTGNDSLLLFKPETSRTYYIETASEYNSIGSYKLKVEETSNTLGTIKATGDGSHTIMVYLGGDNDLEQHMVDDLIEMQIGKLPEGWNVTFLIDRAEGHYYGHGDWTDTRQGVITFADDSIDENIANTQILSTMESLGELNTGDGQTLTNFINWSAKMAQADSYSLVLSNHGGGIPGSIWDDGSNGDNLAISELTDALEATTIHQNALANDDKGFEMIGFDTCLQGIIDQQYALTSVTDVVLASEEVSWTHFWNYDDWFEKIVEEYDKDGNVTGEDMARVYVDNMKVIDTDGKDLTYSAVYTEELDTVIEKFAELNSSLSTITASEKQKIQSEASSVVQFGKSAQMDIGAFANVIDSLDIGGAGSSVDQNAQAVKQAVADAVFANATNMTGNGGDATGIAFYFNGGYEKDDYMNNYELAELMNMHELYEVV
jgi:hypothetical protein